MGSIRTASDGAGQNKRRFFGDGWRTFSPGMCLEHSPLTFAGAGFSWAQRCERRHDWRMTRFTPQLNKVPEERVETSFISPKRRVCSCCSGGKKVIHNERNSLFSPGFLNHLTLAQFSCSLSEPTNGPISRKPLSRVYITEPEWKDDIRGDSSLWKSKPPTSDHSSWAETWGPSS